MIELSVLWGILWKSGYLDITPVWHETGNLAKFDIFNLDSFRFVISPVGFLALHQPAFWTMLKWFFYFDFLLSQSVWGWGGSGMTYMGAGYNDGRHMGGVYGDIDIFLGDWTCTNIAIQRIRAQYLGVMRDHLQRDYYVWQQKIFIDHRNDNRANRTSLKSLQGSRYSRMCTSTTTTCVRESPNATMVRH